jgi:hypothetical protein
MYTQLQNLSDLRPGDIIRPKHGDINFVVTANYGNRVTAVKTADVTNPIEWEVMNEEKSNPKQP